MIIYENNNAITFTPSITKYPEELSGSWFCFTNVTMDEHPIIVTIAGLYFNNDYPTGTIINSNYILDQCPDIYGTWDKDYKSNKIFVSPKLRKSGKGKNGLQVADQFIKFLGHDLKYVYGEHNNGDFLVKGAYQIDKEIKNKEVDDYNMFDFRDPGYPIIYFDKRFIKYEA